MFSKFLGANSSLSKRGELSEKLRIKKDPWSSKTKVNMLNSLQSRIRVCICCWISGALKNPRLGRENDRFNEF